MRILLANSTCKVGGVSTFMLSMQQALASAGHDCSLFFFEHGAMEEHLPSGVPVRFGDLADCLRLVHRSAIDVVHANNIDWTTGISAVRNLGVRLVLTAHKVREPAWTYGWRASNCDGFAAVSQWIADALQPYTDAPITVVRNGIDTHRFTPSAEPPGAPIADRDRPIVAWVGRGSAARKRLERFAAVAPRLRDAGHRVWVIDQQGPRQFAAHFPQAAAALETAAERWSGVPYDEMPATYRLIAASGGCVVSTASMEGLPLTLLEAQACGVPVIAADVPGVNECVSIEHGGVLYPDGTGADALASLIVDTLADRAEVAARQTAAARFAAERFSLERLVREYTRLYSASKPRRRGVVRARRTADDRSQRLGVAYRQFEASLELHRRGATTLAAAAARAALVTTPTMYLRPRRLVHLLATHSPRLWLLPVGNIMKRQFDAWFAVTPREKAPKPCGTDDVLDGRKPCQMGWYEFVAGKVTGQQVLDVGCGSGEGLKVLTRVAGRAVGIDLDERLRRPDVEVEIKNLSEVPSKSFDVVVALDVIEHVDEDRAFVADLFRVARKAVFVTTPNYTISRNRHPYHVREYTPAEFHRLFSDYGDVTLFGGSSRGLERVEITRRGPYFLVNALYTWKPTQLAAKVLKRLFGLTIYKHNAALVRLRDEARQTQAPAAAA